MKKKLNVEWLYAAFIRALRTMAQTALGMFTVGAALSEINWIHILSVSGVALIYSMLTSLATNLPEVGADGTLEIDTTDPDVEVYRFVVDDSISSLANKKSLKIKVDPTVHLKTDPPSQ